LILRIGQRSTGYNRQEVPCKARASSKNCLTSTDIAPRQGSEEGGRGAGLEISTVESLQKRVMSCSMLLSIARKSWSTLFSGEQIWIRAATTVFVLMAYCPAKYGRLVSGINLIKKIIYVHMCPIKISIYSAFHKP
jgi:hypothetical protein